MPVHNLGASRAAALELSWGVSNAQEAFSTALGSTSQVLSPQQAVDLLGGRGLCLGTRAQWCQPVCSGAFHKAAPSSSGHQHVLHQGHC